MATTRKELIDRIAKSTGAKRRLVKAVVQQFFDEIIAAFAGAVYKSFRRDIHVVEPFEIPADWPRWRSIDWGFNNPLACLWVARDPDRRWYVYAEHYQARECLAFHAERIKQISGRERYRCTWADHDAQDRHEFENLGIQTTPARKDVHAGIDAVQGVLKLQADGRPRLYIFSTCQNTIRETSGYKWAEGTESKDAKDGPLGVDDHACDLELSVDVSVPGALGKVLAPFIRSSLAKTATNIAVQFS